MRLDDLSSIPANPRVQTGYPVSRPSPSDSFPRVNLQDSQDDNVTSSKIEGKE